MFIFIYIFLSLDIVSPIFLCMYLLNNNMGVGSLGVWGELASHKRYFT